MFCGDVAPYGIWREGRERQAANNDYTTMIAVVVWLCASLYTPIVILFATIVCIVIHRYICGSPFAMWMFMSIAVLKFIRYVYVYVCSCNIICLISVLRSHKQAAHNSRLPTAASASQ